MIQVEGLSKSYGSALAVDNVSFTVETGEVLGLLGPNGAGKTTLMKALTGYHFPTQGTAIIDGKDLVDSQELKSIVGYLPEHAPLYGELNVREYLEFAAGAQLPTAKGAERRKAIERAASRCGILSVFEQSIDTLSKGYRQRVGLAQAILHDPKVLILDEPTTGLDPNQIHEIRSLISELAANKTIILSTHIMQEVEAVCSRVLILNKGTIVADGSPSSVKAELRGGAQYLCGFVGDVPSIAQQIPSLDHYSSHEVLSDHQGIAQFRLVFDTKADEKFGAIISRWANEKGLSLCQLSMETASLEDVFTALTSQSNPSEIQEDDR